MNKFMQDYADFIGPVVVPHDVTYRGKTRSFHFRELSGIQAETIFGGNKNPENKDDRPAHARSVRASTVAAMVVNLEGEPMMDEEQAGKLPNHLLNALFKVCLAVNAMTEESREEAGNAPSGASSSGGLSS